MSGPADWFEIEPAAPTGESKADAVRATLAAKVKLKHMGRTDRQIRALRGTRHDRAEPLR